MDGTFRTVPTVFRQLYTIHAPVGTSKNSQIFPLIYALMSSKSAELYTQLFQDLNDIAAENEFTLRPSTIITDFEIAAINAFRDAFPDVTNKGCFFHFAQSGWRKVQESGLSVQYSTDNHLNLKICQLFALAFLPPADPAAFDMLKVEIPPAARNIVQWFEEYYVYGKVRRVYRNGNVSRNAPLFSPTLWSVFDSVEAGIPRTQNK
ncbi:15411_t:CDS:1, partial [Gigaspora margarita]